MTKQSSNDATLLEEAKRIREIVAAKAAEHDRETSFPIEGMEAIVKSPLNRAILDGVSWVTYGAIVSELCGGDASFGTAWLMHQGSASLNAMTIDPEQRALLDKEFKDGAWFGNSLSEPTGGNLFLHPLQKAEACDGGWRLSGAKRFVSGCEHAKYLLVNAVCDDKPGFFLIDKDDSIEIREVWDTMGMRGTRSQLLEYRETLLPKNRLLAFDMGKPNAINLGLPWISIGIAEAAMNFAIEYAKERQLPMHGCALAEQQWVQFAVADMSVRLEAARSLAIRACEASDRMDPDFFVKQIQSKIVANEAAIAITNSALEITGGSGYFRSRPLERYARDALSGPMMALSPAVIRDFVGKMLLGVKLPGQS